MFKIAKERTATRTVVIQVQADGKGFKEAETRVTWVFFPESELARVLEEARGVDGDEKGITFWKKVTRGWDGYVDEEGNALAFNDSNLELVLDQSCVRVAWLRDYFNAQYAQVRRGN